MLAVVEAIKLTTGFGHPYDGGSLNGGAAQLAILSEQLTLAVPDGDWTGPAADAYRKVLGMLQGEVSNVIFEDTKLAPEAKREAEIVDLTRLMLGTLTGLLSVAGFIEEYAASSADITVISWFKFWVQSAAAAGVLALGGIMTYSWTRSDGPKSDATDAGKKYSNYGREMRDFLKEWGGSARTEVPAAAQETRFFGFEDILTSKSTPSAQEATWAASVFTTSVPAEVTAAPGGPALSPGRTPFFSAERPVAQPNRRPGTLTQWSTASSAGRAAPTEGAPAVEGGADGSEAGAGTWAAAQRAPVDVAVGPKQGGSLWRI